ncbi:hypothetical protein EHS25_004145 [Saitozyma podzolica]|uniref:Uncharacterized protein n=1 Tax=Saitozyma podzolica TaxID=1890683 RepID=A0A427YTD6_9TREE|nr:hypothetical protein EHS25_004145 [Saitozyma podzolica]
MVWRTTFITISTCFLLGTTFTHWIADHNVLWRTPLTSEALESSIKYYSILSNSPTGLGWVYIAGNRGEIVFDGASVVLLASIAYTQISEVFPTIALFPNPLPQPVQKHPLFPALSTAVRDLANDNVMTAVMLTGIMLLQAGRYYAKKPSSSSVPSGTSSGPSTPPQQAQSLPVERHKAMELNGFGGGKSKKKNKKR